MCVCVIIHRTPQAVNNYSCEECVTPPPPLHQPHFGHQGQTSDFRRILLLYKAVQNYLKIDIFDSQYFYFEKIKSMQELQFCELHFLNEIHCELKFFRAIKYIAIKLWSPTR